MPCIQWKSGRIWKTRCSICFLMDKTQFRYRNWLLYATFQWFLKILYMYSVLLLISQLKSIIVNVGGRFSSFFMWQIPIFICDLTHYFFLLKAWESVEFYTLISSILISSNNIVKFLHFYGLNEIFFLISGLIFHHKAMSIFSVFDFKQYNGL